MEVQLNQADFFLNGSTQLVQRSDYVFTRGATRGSVVPNFKKPRHVEHFVVVRAVISQLAFVEEVVEHSAITGVVQVIDISDFTVVEIVWVGINLQCLSSRLRQLFGPATNAQKFP
jgi:hypothetical protein